jgi:arylsulfatase A-like enzyme
LLFKTVGYKHIIIVAILVGLYSCTSYEVDVAVERQLVSVPLARPNILLLMAEDMSARVGSFGDPVAITPNIDRLAEAGVRYPNTFTTAGVCAPSRAAHITGMHQIAFGGQHMRTRSYKTSPYRAVPPKEVKAYPELLRKAGYYTFTNQKLDYQFSNTMPDSGPFTIWDYEGAKPDWNRRLSGQPFFGMINLNETHESQLFEKNIAKNKASGLLRDQVKAEDVLVPPYYPDGPRVRKAIARHYNNIEMMDRRVGAILEKLKGDGLSDNTIVIWTTDHGDGLPRAKREIYDSGIKVPMIVHWPDGLRPSSRQVGSVDERLVSFVDLGPIVLSIAGEQTPEFMHGRNVLADGVEARQYIYASKDRIDEFPFRERAVRDHRFKYLLNYLPNEPGGKHIAYRDQLGMMDELWQALDKGVMNQAQRFWFEPRPAEELYDIQADPDEINNLANDPRYQAELIRMREALHAWQQQTSDYSEQPELAMAQSFWPGGKQPVTAEPRVSVGEHGRVELQCSTRGASIGYRIDDGRWQVYDQPLQPGSWSKLETKAVRYGWQESNVVHFSNNDR